MKNDLTGALTFAGERPASASKKALSELRVYFRGGRGKLRILGFICQILVASTVVFALISLIDLGSVLLHAILLVTNSQIVGDDYAQRFVMNLPAKYFIVGATEALIRHVPFNAVASLAFTATAEIYCTKRRASRLMPPAQEFLQN